MVGRESERWPEDDWGRRGEAALSGRSRPEAGCWIEFERRDGSTGGLTSITVWEVEGRSGAWDADLVAF